MKILIISQYFYPETFRVNTLSTELVKRGHDVTVLTGYPQYPQGKIYDGYGFRKPYEKEWNGVKIERVKQRPRGRTPLGLLLNCYSYVRQGKKWVKKCKEKYDAVYVFGTSPATVGLVAVAYKKKFGSPVFYNLQDLWPESVEIVLGVHNKIIIAYINKIVNKIYSASNKILCSSSRFIERVEKRGVSREKLIFWPQFCIQPNFEGLVKPECYSDKNFNIVFTGNIGEAQGLDLLIDASIRLKDTNVKWFLVGDGRARERLESRVKENGLEDKIIFVGRVTEEEANRYIHYADCAYLSFMKNELLEMTIPAKLQSYLACGTPILVASSGESAEIVSKAECGFVCEQSAEALEALVRNKILTCDNFQKMRENAKKYFNEHFTIEMLIAELENLFKLEIDKENTKN